MGGGELHARSAGREPAAERHRPCNAASIPIPGVNVIGQLGDRGAPDFELNRGRTQNELFQGRRYCRSTCVFALPCRTLLSRCSTPRRSRKKPPSRERALERPSSKPLTLVAPIASRALVRPAASSALLLPPAARRAADEAAPAAAVAPRRANRLACPDRRARPVWACRRRRRPVPPAAGGRAPSFGAPNLERPSSFRIGGRFFGWEAVGVGNQKPSNPPPGYSGTAAAHRRCSRRARSPSGAARARRSICSTARGT